MGIQLFTLGTVRLTSHGSTIVGPPAQRRRLALLALLSAAGERGLSREKAIGFLWQEQSAARARHLLSEAMYVLRKVVGDNGIVATQDELRLSGDVIWSDVVAFRQALRVDPVSAVDLYHGPFLDGFYLNDAEEFEKWADGERAQIADQYVRALEKLADQAAHSGDHVKASEYWSRIAQHEPFSGRVALRYMETLAAAGDRAHALQHASAFAERLRDELGIEPDLHVIELARKLESGSLQASARVVVNVPEEARKYGLGELAPEFEIMRLIGVGSVAEVFLAREVPLKRLVAIKVLRPEYAQRETARKRFEREAQSAARIDHPNVLTAYRFGRTSNGYPYIVMPYVTGGTLEDKLAATGPWSAEESRKHLAQIAAGLAAAHRLGIVHRDVRPANIMYQRDSDRPLITDFGIATVMDTVDESTIRLTMPGEPLGNIGYSSLEQLRGESVTDRADVYSWGVIAYEMLIGELPIPQVNLGQMLAAHMSERQELPKLEAIGDRQLRNAIQKALLRRPEARPAITGLISSQMVSPIAPLT